MKHILSLCLFNTMILMVGCSTQTPDKPVSKTESDINVTPEKSEQTEVVEIKEKEILKPGVLQVEVPDDIPLPETAIVVTGTNLGSSGKKHFYIQIPDMESAEKVTEYFAAELPKHGWELLNGKGEERIVNIISLDIKKDDELGRVDSIIENQDKAGTIVHLHLEPIKK